MNRLRIAVLLILCLSSRSLSAKTDGTWQQYAEFVGQTVEMPTFVNFIHTSGATKSNTYEEGRFYYITQQGISYEVAGNSIVTLILQIGPGKKIADTRYHGSLPFNLDAIRDSPEKAVQVLGEPQSRMGMELTYGFQGYKIVLVYQPQLDYVKITNRQSIK